MIAAQPSTARRRAWCARTASTRTRGSGSSSAAATTASAAVPWRFAPRTTWRRTPQSVSCSRRSEASSPSWSVCTSAAAAVRRTRAAAGAAGSPGGRVSAASESAAAARVAVRVSPTGAPRAKASSPREMPSRAAKSRSWGRARNCATALARAEAASARRSGVGRVRRPTFAAMAPRVAASVTCGMRAARSRVTSPGSRPKTDCARAVAAALLTAGSGSPSRGAISPCRDGSSSRPRARTAAARTRGSPLSRCARTRSSPISPRASSSATISA